MLLEPLDVAKLIGLSGCLLSMAVIVRILVRGTLPALTDNARDADHT